MISIIITSYKEPKTIKKAILSVTRQKLPDYEVIVTAPDDETLNEAKKLQKSDKNIKLVRDSGKGKPAALNLAVSKAKGNILILTDGDVHVSKGSIGPLLKKLRDKKVGAVSGNPISTDPKNTKYGYWASLLTKIANERRKKAIKTKNHLFCSGYLFAIRKSLFPKLSEDLLSEDGFISHKVYEKGYKIEYSEKSEVYVKYPDNFSDWIKQKRRSAGGYKQLKESLGIEIRSFKKESLGAFGFLKYVSNPKELFWLLELFLARVYLWYRIHRDVDLKKKTHKEIWERVESTK